ncbi:protein germ cell-less [Drosophila grimshawi]|uniref:GH23097 n=1 Tax=Drosophila grimshawi TaxID=7222 RepID=B4JVD1_DROGR|nr:protein germ cell-less [Drosophila grimshawi]XP_032597079.1 protein germ cell-less [Drosophila grimshawi]EDV98399.1 GH23097 [Drosophila grimshawi]
MGQIVGSMQTNVAEVFGGVRRKRKRSQDSTVNQEEIERAKLEAQSPKKKKLLTTTQYIYKALFKEQKNSDVAVMALDKVWHLHKVYLSQSPYFYSMFNGSWKESQQNFVHIQILDDRINVNSVDAVFGSMYSDEIEIEMKDVIAVLATATLFHLDGIIDKCAEVMVDSINAETAIHYYEAACQYGVMLVKKATFKWFQLNLLSIYSKQPNLLRHIPIELMYLLTASSDLYVMQTEFSLYTLLRTWMFLQLHPHYDPDDPVQRAEAQKQQERLVNAGVETHTPSVDVVQWTYFASRMEERSFLATPEGQPYVRVFQRLRTQYLTNHYMDLKIIFNDNIIPKEWLYRHIHSHWDALLRIDHGQDDSSPKQLDNEEFLENCMRCGRLLLEPGYQKWRWTGFNYGMDLILIMDSRRLNIRRHHRHEHERVLSLQTKRKFMIRTTVTSINAQRQPVHSQRSEIITLSLEKNEEVSLMVLDSQLVHPLLISINMLVVMPPNQSFKEIVPLLVEESSSSSSPTTTIPISEIGGATCERSLTPGSADDSAVCVGGSSAGGDSDASPPPPTSRFSWAARLTTSDVGGEPLCRDVAC